MTTTKGTATVNAPTIEVIHTHEHHHNPDIQKVEVITGRLEGFWVNLYITLFALAYRTLFVWVAFAVLLPEWGFTYWHCVPLVYAARMLFGGGEFRRTFSYKFKDWALNKVTPKAVV